jgi:hypothetical protein
MKVHTATEVGTTCGPFTLEAQRGGYCLLIFHEREDLCGCEVTGEATTTRTSLSVTTEGGSPVTAVECR